MNLETFLFLLLVTSVLTGLFTEGIKKFLSDLNKIYKANILAGTVSAVLSVAVSAGYVILTDTAFNDKMAVFLIALVLLSWLCAMVGYDKVMQAITQIKIGKAQEGAK